MHPNLALWVLLKKKKNFRPTDPTFSEIPLEGNTTIIFFGLIQTKALPVNMIYVESVL